MFNPNKGFIFNSSEATFYLRDSLIRTTSYKIHVKETLEQELKIQRFSIVFADTKEQWGLYFISKGN
jgi:hypothetical protein